MCAQFSARAGDPATANDAPSRDSTLADTAIITARFTPLKTGRGPAQVFIFELIEKVIGAPFGWFDRVTGE